MRGAWERNQTFMYEVTEQVWIWQTKFKTQKVKAKKNVSPSKRSFETIGTQSAPKSKGRVQNRESKQVLVQCTVNSSSALANRVLRFNIFIILLLIIEKNEIFTLKVLVFLFLWFSDQSFLPVWSGGLTDSFGGSESSYSPPAGRHFGEFTQGYCSHTQKKKKLPMISHLQIYPHNFTKCWKLKFPRLQFPFLIVSWGGPANQWRMLRCWELQELLTTH